MKTISVEEAAVVIQGIRTGQFFSVTFEKRTTGEMRTMTCRTGVKKHLAGGEAKYVFSAKGLVPVFDMVKREYRCFPIRNLKEIRAGGKTFKVA